LNIIISNASNLPIYEQIYTQMKNAILLGDLSEGDLLPSIRQLAKDLRISVITTKRAYDELERDGFLYTVAGKGSYVAAKNTGIIREGQLKEIEEHMREILRLAPACELTGDDLQEQFRVIIEEEYRT
jgi:GntR family transcriptional regulator